MKRKLLSVAGILVLIAAALVVIFPKLNPGDDTVAARKEEAAQATALSVDYVAGNAEKYHRKVVRVEGKISSPVKQKKFKGKDYTVFKMKNSEKGATVLVYLKGVHAELEKNNKLNIKGRFYKSRRYFLIKLKNVLKGKEFEVLG